MLLSWDDITNDQIMRGAHLKGNWVGWELAECTRCIFSQEHTSAIAECACVLQIQWGGACFEFHQLNTLSKRCHIGNIGNAVIFWREYTAMARRRTSFFLLFLLLSVNPLAFQNDQYHQMAQEIFQVTSWSLNIQSVLNMSQYCFYLQYSSFTWYGFLDSFCLQSMDDSWKTQIKQANRKCFQLGFKKVIFLNVLGVLVPLVQKKLQ